MRRERGNKMTILNEGNAVFIRTVTYHYIGEVVAVDDNWITLKDVAWVADSGRWSAALKTGDLNEVEPYPDGEVIINIGAVTDISSWMHKLPRKVK